jgi:hypothetical protein
MVYGKCFSNTNSIENNWEFHYYVIKDKINSILATFFMDFGRTICWHPESISLQLEEKGKIHYT